MEEEKREEADRRREAAIASAASLRPNFKPKSGLTHSHLSKFQELHKRRLQIKAKSSSKVTKRAKGLSDGVGKSHKKPPIKDQEPINPIGDTPSVDADNVAAKKRQKLLWGLDAKERWERKSNM